MTGLAGACRSQNTCVTTGQPGRGGAEINPTCRRTFPYKIREELPVNRPRSLSRGDNDASARSFASTVITVTHSRIKVHGVP